MLSKKWRKLPLKENLKTSLEEEEKNDEKNKKEIIIVDINTDDRSEPKKEEEKEKEKNKNSKEEININSFHLYKKPQPIIQIDPTSIQTTKYKIENNIRPNYSYNNYNIEEIKKRYSPRLYNNENITYQINDINPSFEEIKNRYINKRNLNIMSKAPENLKSDKYMPRTYRNNNTTYGLYNNDNKAYKISNPYR